MNNSKERTPGPNFVRTLVELAHRDVPMWLPEEDGGGGRLEASAGVLELSVERTDGESPETHTLRIREWVNGQTGISLSSQEEPNVSALYHSALGSARKRRKQILFVAEELKPGIPEQERDHSGVRTMALALAQATRNHSLEWRSHHGRGRSFHLAKSAFAEFRVDRNVQDSTLTVTAGGRLLGVRTERRTARGQLEELLDCMNEAREETAREALEDEDAPWEAQHILKSLL